eukprot:433364-Pyramimonas_sp.AAC.1
MDLFVANNVQAVKKIKVSFGDLNGDCWAPCVAPVGASLSWPQGVEVVALKKSIKEDYSFYSDKDLHVYRLRTPWDVPGGRSWGAPGVPLPTAGDVDYCLWDEL